MSELKDIPDDISIAILKLVNENNSGDIILNVQNKYITGIKFVPQEINIPREKIKSFVGDIKQ